MLTVTAESFRFFRRNYDTKGRARAISASVFRFFRCDGLLSTELESNIQMVENADRFAVVPVYVFTYFDS